MLADLKAWWKVLKPGGTMFGDDYHIHWAGVIRAVHEFAESMKVAVDARFQNKWLVQKPTAP